MSFAESEKKATSAAATTAAQNTSIKINRPTNSWLVGAKVKKVNWALGPNQRVLVKQSKWQIIDRQCAWCIAFKITNF